MGEAKQFNIPLRKAKLKGKSDIQAANRDIALLYCFFKKHFRKEKKQVKISGEVNEKIWENSNKGQGRIQVQAIEKEGNVMVYLKDSRELKEIAEKEARQASEKKPKREESKEKTATPVSEEEKEKTAGGKKEKPAVPNKKKPEGKGKAQ